MKKKLLLTGVAAMALLAVGVGATSTFAWFQANALVGAIKNGATDSITAQSVSDPHYTADTVDIPLRVVLVDAGTTTGDLELAHYYELGGLDGKNNAAGGTFGSDSAAGFYKGYYKTTVATSLVFSSTPELNHRFYIDYKVGVYVSFPTYDSTIESNTDDKIKTTSAPNIGSDGYWYDSEHTKVLWRDKNGNDWEEDEVKDGVVGKTVTYSLAHDTSPRVMFFNATLTPATDLDLTKAVTGNDAANTLSAAAAGKAIVGVDHDTDNTTPNRLTATKAAPEFIGRFGMYVEGSNEGDNDISDYDSADVPANFTITISKGS